MTDAIAVYVTFPDTDSAARIARSVVEKRLAACANIMPGMQSLYWWQGKMEDAAEVCVFFKTQADRFTALEAAVKAAHPYEVPCIVALPLTQGHGPYLDWIRAQVGQ